MNIYHLATATAMMIILQAKAQNDRMTLDHRTDIGIGTTAITHQGLYLNEIKPKALRDFNRRYKGVEAGSWEKMPNGEIRAYISNASGSITTYYTCSGDWAATLKSYKENGLPPEIRHLVKSTYYDYSITAVDQISIVQNDMTTYLLYLKNKNQYKIIRICDGEMDIWEEHQAN